MNRMAVSELNQAATEKVLRDRGLPVSTYGQELLTPAARQMLRRAASLSRWLADFIVDFKPGPVLVDAKFSYPWNVNHSIEMRSLLAARHDELSTHYVCSFWDDTTGTFTDFKSIVSTDVPTTWPCCPSCLDLFLSSTDVTVVNRILPEHCIAAKKRGGSGTPYFVVEMGAFPSYGDPFGFAPAAPQPCRVCGGLVLPSSKWSDCHPACHQWPDAGIRYGPTAGTG